jgi:hypothetical protein
MPKDMNEPEEVVKVIATGVTFTVGLSDDRQMTFQSGFEGDESDEAVNARFDRLMNFADRQQARYQIKGAEKKLAQHRLTVAQFEIDEVDLVQRHAVQQAQRQVELDERIKERDAERKKFQAEIDGAILDMQARRKQVWDYGAAEHTASGRLSAYEPKGQVKINIAHIDKAIAEAGGHRAKALEGFDADYAESIAVSKAEIEKSEATFADVLKSRAQTRAKWDDIAADLEADIERCRELIGA